MTESNDNADKVPGWKKRAETYKNAGEPAKMKDEDSIAGQIMKGLGWRLDKMDLLASITGIKIEEGEPRITTAENILNAYSGGVIGGISACRKFILSTKRVTLTKAGLSGSVVGGLCSLAAAQPVGGGVLVMNRGKTRGWSYGIVFLHDMGWRENVPMWLLEPVSVLKWRSPDGQVTLWMRDLASMVKDMARICGWDIQPMANFN